MGLTIATLTLTLAAGLCAPQVQDPPNTVLSSSQLKSLNKKARDWMGGYIKYVQAADSGKGAAKANRAQNKARDKFMKDWRKLDEKHGLLKSVPDLREIFRDCFPYQNPKGLLKDQVSAMKVGKAKWDVYLPKSYKPSLAQRFVVQLAGLAEGDTGAYESPRDYFAKTWKEASLTKDTLFILPAIDAVLDFDAVPDFSRAGEEEKDDLRRRVLFQTAGLSQRELNLDRSRFVLDCGRGSCAFGLRMATYFPDRFAGLILRYPDEVDLRLESLCGLPVLLIANKDAKNLDYCKQLAEKLNALHEGACKLIETADTYPFGGEKEPISEWTKGVERNLFRDHVIVAPNHDQYRSAYWVFIGTAEPLAGVSDDDQPIIEARVDREANQITVEAKSVENLVLRLNDDIVDLDKDVTVVINGVALKKKRSRQFSLMRKLIQSRFDPNQLFTVEWRLPVPAKKK